MPISKALRYGACVTSFTCHPHTSHTCLYSLAARRHRPLAGILIALTHEGTVRLSWPGYRDNCPASGIEPGHGHPSQY